MGCSIGGDDNGEVSRQRHFIGLVQGGVSLWKAGLRQEKIVLKLFKHRKFVV